MTETRYRRPLLLCVLERDAEGIRVPFESRASIRGSSLRHASGRRVGGISTSIL